MVEALSGAAQRFGGDAVHDQESMNTMESDTVSKIV